MTSDNTNDAISCANDAPHPIDDKGKPVQPVQFEHPRQQTATHSAENKALFTLDRESRRTRPGTWAEIEAEAGAMDRADVARGAAQSHNRQHWMLARKPGKASSCVGVTKGHGDTWKAGISHQPSGTTTPYLGAFGTEERAATAYDIMAVVFYGPDAATNFPASAYERFLTPSVRNILKQAFTVDGRAARKEAREALAWLVRQVASAGTRRPDS